MEDEEWQYESLMLAAKLVDLGDQWQRMTQQLCSQGSSSTSPSTSTKTEALDELLRCCSSVRMAYGSCASLIATYPGLDGLLEQPSKGLLARLKRLWRLTR